MSGLRRVWAPRLILLAAMGALGGCVYNPYTGTWMPCCGYYYGYPYSYGYPYYRYPAPYPYGYPPQGYMAPPQGQPGAAPPPNQLPPRPGASNGAPGGALAQRFAAANVTHDGRLTRSQAAAMPMVERNFDAIDAQGRGYVTLDEVRAFAAQRRAERAQTGPSVQ
jgi:hypothetical protein